MTTAVTVNFDMKLVSTSGVWLVSEILMKTHRDGQGQHHQEYVHLKP